MNRVFSFIYAIDTEEWTEESGVFLKNILDLGNTEVFLYDIVGDEEGTKAGKELEIQYEGRAFFRNRVDWNPWQCYNEALLECRGNYVNFTKITALFQPEDLVQIEEAFERYQVSMVTLTPVQVMGEKSKPRLFFNERNMVIDSGQKPFHTNMCLASCFVEREAMNGIRFREEALSETDEFTLVKLLEQMGKYAVLEQVCEIREYLFFDVYNYRRLYEKEWYTKELRDVYLPFLKENPASRVRQAWILRLIEVKLAGNSNDRNKSVLTSEERENFFETISQIFQYMEDDILVQYRWNHKRLLKRFMSANYLRMKYHCEKLPVQIVTEPDTKKQAVAIGGTIVERFDKIQMKLWAINDEGHQLSFDGELLNMYYAEDEEIRICLCINGEEIPVKRIQAYRYFKLFGKPVYKGYMFHVVLPGDRYQGKDVRFHFEIHYKDQVIRPKHGSINIQSRIRYNVRFSYWRFGNQILRYDEKSRELIIERASLGKVCRYELLYEGWMWKQSRKSGITEEEKRTLRDSLILRMEYFLTKPFYKKRKIWVTADQLFKGGDNGEYFFRYMREHHKEIDMYYILNEDAPEYRELQSRYGNVLKFGSRRAKLLSLHADMIFDTRANVKLYSGFTAQDEYNIRDLFNAEVVCLQHGLTIQKIAQYQNRLFDNLKYYFCVSPYEVENIRKPIYDYTDDMISLTGAPRYDGLTGEPLKQILITPTWRRNVTEGTNTKGKNHAYSVNFRNTAYYQIYNTLINDERLIACAKETGYKLIYLIHPILSPQIDDFDTNDYVEICPGANVNYEKILKESSLMVTDYSGVQFDFAYMRRPLIYYHPDRLPPQYEEGNLKYDTMGFGPICKNNEEIVNELCRFMRNGCRLDELYRKRIEDFFPYNDQENCRRVYEAAMEFQKRSSERKK